MVRNYCTTSWSILWAAWEPSSVCLVTSAIARIRWHQFNNSTPTKYLGTAHARSLNELCKSDHTPNRFMGMFTYTAPLKHTKYVLNKWSTSMQEVCTVGLYQLQYLTVIEPLTSMLDRQTLSHLYEGHEQVNVAKLVPNWSMLVSVSIQSCVCVAKHMHLMFISPSN